MRLDAGYLHQVEGGTAVAGDNRGIIADDPGERLVIDRVRIDAGMAAEGFAPAEHLELSGSPGQRGEQGDDLVEQAGVVPAEAVPLEHAEFRRMQSPELLAPEGWRERPDITAAGGQQALERVLGAGGQEAWATGQFEAERQHAAVEVGAPLQHRGIDLEHSAISEESAGALDQLGALTQRLAGGARPPRLSVRSRCLAHRGPRHAPGGAT
jgi:hypothetical protein